MSAQSSILKQYQIADSIFNAHYNDTSSIALVPLEHILTLQVSDSLKAETYSRIGITLLRKRLADSTNYYYKKALDIFLKQNNKLKQSRVYTNIADMFLDQKNYKQAITYDSLAIATAQLDSDSLSLYINMCNLYLRQHEYQKSYEIITNNVLRFQKKLISDQDYFIDNDIGLYYKNIKKYDSSIYFFKRSLNGTDNKGYQVSSYINIGDVNNILKNYKLAILSLDSAFAINQQFNYKDDILAIYDGYKETYQNMGNAETALKYAELGRKFSDSFYIQANAQALTEADVRYQTTKKEEVNQLMSKDIIIKNRNFLFSLIALTLVVLLAAITFRSYKQKQKANKILTVQRNQVQQLANQLEVANQTKARLFSTIGHDLRSPISSLYALLKMQEINGGNNIDAAAMSTQTINLLDTLEDLLVWSKTQMDRFVPMPVKINISALYNELTDFFAGTAMAKNVQVINKTEAGLTFRCDENILRTMLRNAIGNALNHTAVGENIILSAQKNDGEFICTIKNPCSEIDFERFQSAFKNADVQSGSHGLGLVLIKEFADKINAQIKLSYADNWVAMHILLPINA